MRRRRLLAACGGGLAGLAGIAGCLSAPPGSDGAGGETPGTTARPATATSTPTSEPAWLAVSVTSLAPAVVELTTPDSIGVSRAEGYQFLSLEVSVESGDPPAREEIQVRFDGRRYGPLSPDPGAAERRLWRAYEDGEGSYAGWGDGWLVYEFPATGDPSDAALTWPGEEEPLEGETPTGDPLRTRLERRAPPLSVEFSAPETASPASTPTVSFEVTNEGENGGRFVAGLNRSGPRIAYTPVEAVSWPVPADSTETWEVTDGNDVGDPGAEAVGDDEPDFTYHVEWTGGSTSQDVRLVE